jgi:hypothetical protein
MQTGNEINILDRKRKRIIKREGEREREREREMDGRKVRKKCEETSESRKQPGISETSTEREGGREETDQHQI